MDRLPEDIKALRTARYDFGDKRAHILQRIRGDVELAEATKRMLEAAREVINAGERVPYQLDSHSETFGELDAVCWRRRAELEPLANSYGLSIVEHSRLRGVAQLTYWDPFPLEDLLEQEGPAV
jgi:hypothetical protein